MKGCPQGPQARGAIEGARLWTCGQPRERRRLRRAWRSPRRASLDDGIQDQQQAAHGRYQSNLVKLAVADQTLIVGAEHRVPYDRRGSSTIEHASQRRPPGAYRAHAAKDSLGFRLARRLARDSSSARCGLRIQSHASSIQPRSTCCLLHPMQMGLPHRPKRKTPADRHVPRADQGASAFALPKVGRIGSFHPLILEMSKPNAKSLSADCFRPHVCRGSRSGRPGSSRYHRRS